MIRLFRATGALAAIVALMIVLPAALVRFVGRPWPRPVPSMDTIWEAIRAGDISDTTVIKALAIIVWVAWARLACSIVLEIVARMSGRSAPRVVLLGSAQQWAAALVAAVVLVVGAGPRVAMASGGANGPRPIAAALLSDHDAPSRSGARRVVPLQPEQFGHVEQSGQLDRLDHVRRGDRSVGATHVAERAQAIGGRWNDVPPASSSHLVQRHESFWSIAEETLGDGSRWREIVDLNSGRLVSPGVVFDGTARRLMPGWELLVPSAAGSDVAVVASPGALDRDVDVASAPRSTVVVQAGDTLSKIAERQLGDEDEWPQLWEANGGHAFGERVFDDPDLILPGWELVLPAAFPPPPAPPLAPPPAPSISDVVPEPTLTPTALPTVAPPTVAPPTVDSPTVDSPTVAPPTVASPTVAADPTPPTAPLTPAAAAPSTTPPTLPRVTSPPTVAEPDPIAVVGNGGAASSAIGVTVPLDVLDAEHAPSSSLSGMGAAVLLASGVIGAVGVRRRRQLRSSVIDSRLLPPTSAAVHTEAVLRRLDSGERIARLDIALRAAARELVEVAPGAGILGAILAGDGRLDLLLGAAAGVAPPPWQVVTDHRWRLPARFDLLEIAESARQANQPCPAMAHIGTTRLEGESAAEVFLDLEAIGLLSIDGARDDARAIVRAIAAGVAVSPMSEIAHMIVCGLDDVRLGRENLRAADTLDTALDLAASAIGATAAMTASGLSTFSLRAHHRGGEAWEPAIVLASDEREDRHLASQDAAGEISDADLVDLAGGGGRGLAVVIDRAVEGGRWVLRCADRRWRIEPLGLEVGPVGLSSDDLEQIETLLEEAGRPPQLTLLPAAARSITGTDRDDEPAPAPPWSLLIRILGPVEVVAPDGSVAQFERSKALELVVWLAQHRDRSTRTGARTALWEANVRDATFANVVSDARRNLARLVAPDAGAEWIGRTLTEDLPLHAHVITDADLLEDRLRVARRLGADAASAVLRPALELVRDMPFSGTSYLWPDTEGITSQLTLLVTSAAALLAGHHLAGNDIEGVFWATGQGLKVLPGHEELIALRMRAHGRRGDLAGVRNEWESYERVLHAEAWSDGEPATKLVLLRRELLGLR